MKTWIAAMSMGVASIGAVLLGISCFRLTQYPIF